MDDGVRVWTPEVELERILNEIRRYNEQTAGVCKRLALLQIPGGTRVVALEGQTPKDVAKRGLHQLRATFVGTDEGMGDLGRQLAAIAPWGFEKKVKESGRLPLLDGGGDRG